MAEHQRSPVLRSYSQVFFSRSRMLGLLLLLASLAAPSVGLVGLFAAVVSAGAVKALGLAEHPLLEGTLGYNGLLLGLVLGAFYQPGVALLAAVALACLGTLLLHVALQVERPRGFVRVGLPQRPGELERQRQGPIREAHCREVHGETVVLEGSLRVGIGRQRGPEQAQAPGQPRVSLCRRQPAGRGCRAQVEGGERGLVGVGRVDSVSARILYRNIVPVDSLGSGWGPGGAAQRDEQQDPHRSAACSATRIRSTRSRLTPRSLWPMRLSERTCRTPAAES